MQNFELCSILDRIQRFMTIFTEYFQECLINFRHVVEDSKTSMMGIFSNKKFSKYI